MEVGRVLPGLGGKGRLQVVCQRSAARWVSGRL